MKDSEEARRLKGQLAERDALLREVLVGLWPSTPIAIKINATLSASAEPSAPEPLCSTCKGYGKYQDGDSGTDEDGRCPHIADCDCDDSERMPQCRASAPVKRDERNIPSDFDIFRADLADHCAALERKP